MKLKINKIYLKLFFIRFYNFEFILDFQIFHIYVIIYLLKMHRLESLELQLVPKQVGTKNPDDIVICSAVRTPLQKAKRGLFKDTAP